MTDEFSSVLRQRRIAARLSQSALSEAMRAAGQTHWHQNTVSRVENGRQPVGLEETAALASILGSASVFDSARPPQGELQVEELSAYLSLIDEGLAKLGEYVAALRVRLAEMTSKKQEEEV